MKSDITNRADIEFLVKTFYEKVLRDKIIGHFFTRVVTISWEQHFNIMYNFWESLIFNEAKYKGNPMTKHINLNKKSSLKKQHFDHWLKLWNVTVDELFEGEKADLAKRKANDMAQLMLYKIEESKNQRFIL